MGTENLFHKRKAKAQQDLKRRAPKWASYDKVLIVCEGGKTEPNYFNELKDYYELDSANVRISGECGSDPMSVVKYGKKLYEEERRKGDAYDRVYFVFDRDTHATYSAALNAIAASSPKGVFHSITSIPCFEYWVLLRFDYTTAPFSATEAASPCDSVIGRLKEYWPEYVKASKNTFSRLLDKLGFAKANAERALSEANRNGTDSPSTYIHELVHYLQNIKDKLAKTPSSTTAPATPTTSPRNCPASPP